MNYVFETYPPQKYPKLYAKPIKHYAKRKNIYGILNMVILVVGMLTLGAIAFWVESSKGSISEIIPFLYFLLQIIPVLLLEISGFAYFRLMRKADIRKTRIAELHPRRLFDFISPLYVFMAVVLFFICILFFLYLDNFQFSVGSDSFVITMTLAASHIVFIATIYWHLYGKKLDPYQAGNDRLRQAEISIKSVVFMSIGSSLFLMFIKYINRLDLNYLEPTFISVFLQFSILIGLGSMLRNLRLENLNFDVYKENVPVS